MSIIKKISPKKLDDSEILQGIANGDSFAIDYLYKTHYPQVERLVLNNNGREDQAKDIFQETVLVLYDRVIQKQVFELNCSLKTYIYAVSRNLWLKQLKRVDRKNASLEDRDFVDISSMDEDLKSHQEIEQKFDKMEEALRQLGDPCNKIIKEFYINNKSMKQICEIFGYNNSDNAKTQKYKCLQRLKKLFFLNN